MKLQINPTGMGGLALVWPLGSTQMVAGSVTKGTIPDYMHGCNGQKAFPHGQGEENTGGPRAWLLLGELSWKISSWKSFAMPPKQRETCSDSL